MVLNCSRKLTEVLEYNLTSIGVFSMLLMTFIVLELTIVLHKNFSAGCCVWHICQKWKRSLVVRNCISCICRTAPQKQDLLFKFKFSRHYLWYKLVGKDTLVIELYYLKITSLAISGIFLIFHCCGYCLESLSLMIKWMDVYQISYHNYSHYHL